MIDVNQLRKGTTFTQNGELFKVLQFAHHKPGRGKATIRVTIRNLRSGATTEKTFNSGERVQDVRLDAVEVEYLYDDGEFLTFLDLESYDQPQVSRSVFGEDALYLKENSTLKLIRYEGEILDYELPITVELAVIDAEAAVAGDTANSPSKKVTCETGLIVTVPLFVNVGDTLRVKTEDARYMTRV